MEHNTPDLGSSFNLYPTGGIRAELARQSIFYRVMQFRMDNKDLLGAINQVMPAPTATND